MIEQIKPNVWRFTCDDCGKIIREVPLNWYYLKGRWERLNSTIDLCYDCAKTTSPNKTQRKRKRIKIVDKIKYIISMGQFFYLEKDMVKVCAKQIAKLIANNYRRRKK
jgi:hypothetical protein